MLPNTKLFHLFLVILFCTLSLICCKPSPQKSSSNEIEDVSESSSNKKGVKSKKEEDEDEEEKEDGDLGKAVSDLLGSLFNLAGTALDTIETIAGDEEVQESVATAVNVGLRTGLEAAKTGVEVAQAAPKVVDETGTFVTGLTKTVEETSGFLSGSLDELEQGAKLFSVFADAYGKVTLNRIEKFSETFNKRFRCNTDCKKLDDGTAEKKECEKKYCEGFTAPKSKKEQDEEKLKELAAQYDYDYSYSSEDDDEEKDD